MDTLDPIHVAILIHSLIELPIAKNTLDGGNLKSLSRSRLEALLFKQIGDRQHGGSFIMLVKDELHDLSFRLVNGQNTVHHLVAIGSATTAVPAAGSLDGTTLAGTQSNVLPLLLCHEM